MKAACRIITTVLLFAASLFADTLETVFFRANLNPANEVPAVAGVTASGRATIAFHLRRNEAGAVVSGVVDFDVDYNFAEVATLVGLHVHSGAAGVNGPILIDSGISATNSVEAQGTGNLFRQVNVDSGAALAALSDALANPANFYVNLHTSVHPAGLMRDQMTRMEVLVFRVILSPTNEVPPISGLDASGTGSVFILATRSEGGTVTAATVRYDVSFRFPAPVTFTGLHIHPGTAGVNGPAVLSAGLSGSNTVVSDTGTGTITRKFEVTSGTALTVLRNLLLDPGGAYLNLHTTDNPGGAIRGQLQPTTETSFQFTMTPDQEVPPIPGLEASGLAKVSVFVTRNEAGEATSGTALFDVNYRFPGSVTLRGFHIHTAPRGVNGSIVIDSGITGTNTVVDEDGVGNLHKIIDVGPTNADGLAAVRSMLVTPENQYLNLHTTVNPGGAIRGQLVAASVPAPAISAGGVISATNALGIAPASPGSLISIYGINQARATAGAAAIGNRLPTSLLGTEVRVGGTLAPLLYVSPLQINAQVPYEVVAGTHAVTVTTPGGISSAQNLTVTAVAPGIFVVVKNADFSRITASNPARAGEVLAIFATGLGAVTPAVASGQLPPLSPLSNTVATPAVTIGGIPATVAASVLAPGYAGVHQVNVTVPAGVSSGAAAVSITIGGQTSNSVSIPVQ